MRGGMLLKRQARLLGSHAGLVTSPFQSIVFVLGRCAHLYAQSLTASENLDVAVSYSMASRTFSSQDTV